MAKRPVCKKSKVRKQLEAHFKMPLSEIVSTHLEIGMSRYKAADTLRELMGWDGTKENQIFSTSSLWNIIKDAITLGEITDFDFRSKSGKQTSGKTETKPKKRSSKKKKTPVVKAEISPPKEEVISIVETSDDIPEEPKIIPVVVTYSCKNCNKSHEETHKKLNPKKLLLRAHKCPHCNSIGQCKAEFEKDGELFHKDVIKDDQFIRECFIDAEGNKIEVAPV